MEKAGIFSVVKHALMLIIPSAYFLLLKLLFLATGGVLNVYDSISGTIVCFCQANYGFCVLVIAADEHALFSG